MPAVLPKVDFSVAGERPIQLLVIFAADIRRQRSSSRPGLEQHRTDRPPSARIEICAEPGKTVGYLRARELPERRDPVAESFIEVELRPVLACVEKHAGAASKSRRCTSSPEPAGAAASRFSRSSAFRSPSLSTQTSPDRTSGASPRRRAWTVFAETPRSAGSAGFWTLSGVNLLNDRKMSSIIDSTTGCVW